MDINIIEEKENLLFNRKEIKFECLYEGEATPKVFEVKNKLVAMLDADKDLLVVDKIDQGFGEPRASGYAKLYESLEKLREIEPEHVIKKNTEASQEEEEEE
ncbi:MULTISPECIES: 30S ribosomal protein S24e [Methanothermobacter]|uniref:Small ribosomal subunit protein eS24 n=1 Tax=Methanothermobacter wolfeii TaxID=145261 RepID=A0A9E7RUB1_METWO|nr:MULTISPECIES: 30S ribosomal protein S24e [Methanothermobacter]NLM02252.1 30S ribosomal protein S24e [Methanothermobacter wolfeii]QHN06180.1 30S ribosomal protein S24e [Methanothermobacter sp. THM-1]UXH32381.1 30S ribosomal protein S24e [Methanothermobacter wolfeii]